jgi:hypothetical protein
MINVTVTENDAVLDEIEFDDANVHPSRGRRRCRLAGHYEALHTLARCGACLSLDRGDRIAA